MGEIFNKDYFIRRMAKKGYTLKDCSQIVDDLFDTICEIMAEGNGIKFRGFGCFEVRERAARTGMSPSTGEKIKIPPSKAAHFTVGTILKKAVREGKMAD